MTISVAAAADLIGIGRSKAYELVRSDKFPTPVRQIGRRYLVLRNPLLVFLGAQATAQSESECAA